MKIALLSYHDEVIERIRQMKTLNVRVIKYSSVESFYESHERYDLIISDVYEQRPIIDMIKEKAKGNTMIIFVATTSDLMEKAFGKNVIGYVLKDEMYKIDHLLLEAGRNMVKELVIVNRHETVRVPFKDIEYISYELRDIYVSACDNQVYKVINKDLKRLTQELDERFIAINRNEIVNIDWVKRLIDKDVVLYDGQILHVSLRKKKILQEAFIRRST